MAVRPMRQWDLERHVQGPIIPSRGKKQINAAKMIGFSSMRCIKHADRGSSVCHVSIAPLFHVVVITIASASKLPRKKEGIDLCLFKQQHAPGNAGLTATCTLGCEGGLGASSRGAKRLAAAIVRDLGVARAM